MMLILNCIVRAVPSMGARLVSWLPHQHLSSQERLIKTRRRKPLWRPSARSRLWMNGFVLAALLFGIPVHGQSFDEHTIRQRLDHFRRTNINPSAREITAGGQVAVDCIMDYVEEGHPEYASVYVKGAAPTPRIRPLRNLSRFLELLRRVNAPYPVERLAVLVEKGMGPTTHRSALNTVFRLLAESGHDRARFMIAYHHDLALQSKHPIDAAWAKAAESHLHTWAIAREFITTGEGLTRTPPAALAAMREAYLENPSVIHWECDDLTEFLDIRLRKYAPQLSDATCYWGHISRIKKRLTA